MKSFVLLLSPIIGCAAQDRASTFAGSTMTTLFPPPGITVTANDPNFPPHPGGLPLAGEAEVIATAPFPPKVDSYSPLIQPSLIGGHDVNRRFDVLQHLGGLSPFQSVESFGLHEANERIPKDCKLKQVHLVHRHGARYPTSNSQGSPASFATKLHVAASTGSLEVLPPLQFLEDWTYKLGRNDLTPYGRQQMFDLGSSIRIKYGSLLNGFDSLPVFRTTTSGRMVDSALHFAAGFFGVQTYQQDYHQLIIPESAGFNNTLAPGEVCPNANNEIAAFGVSQALLWANLYLQPTLDRLQKALKGLQLDIIDLVAMQMTCAYETAALGFSSFCEVFNEDEWRGFAYLNDISVWYGGGPGNPSAAAQGVGYVQELLSRLTHTRITDFSSSVNSTLVDSDITFPLDHPIYVDATHDSGMIAIFTAMNFSSFAAGGPLPTNHIPNNQTFFVQNLVPFGARLVGQVLECGSDASPHIRWVLNDAVVPLTGIHGCAENKEGLCELSSFIRGLKERVAEIDFEFDCLGKYTIPFPDTIVDGRFPPALRTDL